MGHRPLSNNAIWTSRPFSSGNSSSKRSFIVARRLAQVESFVDLKQFQTVFIERLQTLFDTAKPEMPGSVEPQLGKHLGLLGQRFASRRRACRDTGRTAGVFSGTAPPSHASPPERGRPQECTVQRLSNGSSFSSVFEPSKWDGVACEVSRDRAAEPR